MISRALLLCHGVPGKKPGDRWGSRVSAALQRNRHAHRAGSRCARALGARKQRARVVMYVLIRL